MIYILPLIIGFISNTIAAKYVRERAEKRLEFPYKPLPDIIHDYFQKIPVFVPDYFLFVCIIVALWYWYDLDQFEKNVLTIGLCSMLRSCTIWFTTMPTCMTYHSNSPFHNTHDLMFSGHTLFFIGIGRMVNSMVIPILGPFLLVVARQHYTIDVCVSGLVYHTIWSIIDQNFQI